VSSSGITIYLPPKGGTIFNTGNLAAGDNITLTESNGVYSINGTANTDTKNTASSTNTSSKIFLIGATSQTTGTGSIRTYSHDTVYVGTDGHLYSNSKQAVNLSDSQTLTNKTL
jgi:hypothetical protein